MIYSQLIEELKNFELQRRFYIACNIFAKNFTKIMQGAIKQIRKACASIGKIFSRFFEYLEYVRYILFNRHIRFDIVYTQFTEILFYDYFNYDYRRLYANNNR